MNKDLVVSGWNHEHEIEWLIENREREVNLKGDEILKRYKAATRWFKILILICLDLVLFATWRLI